MSTQHRISTVIVDYDVVSHNRIDEMILRVCDAIALNEGWEPHGNLLFRDNYYRQPMVKRQEVIYLEDVDSDTSNNSTTPTPLP